MYATAIVKPPASALDTLIVPLCVPGSAVCATTEIVAEPPDARVPAGGLTESQPAPALTLNSTGPQKLLSTTNEDAPDDPMVS